MFTAPVTYQAQEEGVAPLRSIHSYHSDQEALGTFNRLREAGLSEGEVRMVVGVERGGGVAVEPAAMQSRLGTIQEVWPRPIHCHHSLQYMYCCRSCLHMQQDCRRPVAVVAVFWA